METKDSEATSGVIEMGLCEIPHLFLHPGQLYKFVVMPDCPACAKAAAQSNGTYQEKGTPSIESSLDSIQNSIRRIT
jgi:hypothetical protein